MVNDGFTPCHDKLKSTKSINVCFLLPLRIHSQETQPSTQNEWKCQNPAPALALAIDGLHKVLPSLSAWFGFQLETRHLDNDAKWWSIIPSFQHTNFVKLTSVKHEQTGTYFRLDSEQTCAIRTWLLQRNLCNHTQKCGHKSCIVNLCMPPGSCNVSILCIRMFYFCLQQSIATVLRFNKHLADVHLARQSQETMSKTCGLIDRELRTTFVAQASPQAFSARRKNWGQGVKSSAILKNSTPNHDHAQVNTQVPLAWPNSRNHGHLPSSNYQEQLRRR